MNRLVLKDIFRAVMTPKVNETKDTEYLTDNQATCNDELCGVSWKPLSENIELDDEASNS